MRDSPVWVIRDEMTLRTERAEAALRMIAQYEPPQGSPERAACAIRDVAREALHWCVCGYDKDTHDVRNGHCPLRLEMYQPVSSVHPSAGDQHAR